MKFIAYPAIALSGILMVGSIAYFLNKPASQTGLSPAENSSLLASEPVVTVAQQPDLIAQSPSQLTDVAARPAESTPGLLRVSNRTTHPVRIALLSRGSKSSAKSTHHQDPVHWDFAPQEGSGKGLRLSLPNGNLKLSQGDVLVAFAQDGSRSYWGPYVVGESDQPIWNKQAGEWQLILED